MCRKTPNHTVAFLCKSHAKRGCGTYHWYLEALCAAQFTQNSSCNSHAQERSGASVKFFQDTPYSHLFESEWEVFLAWKRGKGPDIHHRWDRQANNPGPCWAVPCTPKGFEHPPILVTRTETLSYDVLISKGIKKFSSKSPAWCEQELSQLIFKHLKSRRTCWGNINVMITLVAWVFPAWLAPGRGQSTLVLSELRRKTHSSHHKPNRTHLSAQTISFLSLQRTERCLVLGHIITFDQFPLIKNTEGTGNPGTAVDDISDDWLWWWRILHDPDFTFS